MSIFNHPKIKGPRHELLKVHKALLRFEKDVFEKLEGRSLSAGDLLTLSISHPDFAWLRMVSELVAEVDERLEDENANLDAVSIFLQEAVKDLFFREDKIPQFKTHLKIAVQSPDVCLAISELKRSLS